MLCLGIAAGAHAKTYNLGSVSSYSSTIGVYGGFTDYFKFTVDSLSTIGYSFTALTTINPFEVELEKKTLGGWTDVPGGFGTSKSSFALASGKYRFDVEGLSAFSKGKYAVNIMTAAVPEADTWLMLIVGAGLVAYQLRRKQQSLPSRAIAAG